MGPSLPNQNLPNNYRWDSYNFYGRVGVVYGHSEEKIVIKRYMNKIDINNENSFHSSLLFEICHFYIENWWHDSKALLMPFYTLSWSYLLDVILFFSILHFPSFWFLHPLKKAQFDHVTPISLAWGGNWLNTMVRWNRTPLEPTAKYLAKSDERLRL